MVRNVVSRSDYERLEAVMSRDPEERRRFVDGFEVLPEPQRTDSAYARLVFGPSSYCTFLADGLCSLHRRYGSQVLSEACATYPRRNVRGGGEAEISATMACPEIARLGLFGVEAPRMVHSGPRAESPIAQVRASLVAVIRCPERLGVRLLVLLRVGAAAPATPCASAAEARAVRRVAQREMSPGSLRRARQEMAGVAVSDEAVCAAFCEVLLGRLTLPHGAQLRDTVTRVLRLREGRTAAVADLATACRDARALWDGPGWERLQQGLTNHALMWLYYHAHLLAPTLYEHATRLVTDAALVRFIARLLGAGAGMTVGDAERHIIRAAQVVARYFAEVPAYRETAAATLARHGLAGSAGFRALAMW